jgi:protein transport protein SEC31
MVYIKQLERSACVTFAPNAPMLACGTAAGAIDLSFSSNSVLEVPINRS